MVVDASLKAAGTIMWSWAEWKLFFERSVSFTTDSMHVISGVVIMLLTAVIIRRPISDWRPWLLVLLLALFNEFSDLWIERWLHPGRQLGESVKDVLLTLALPTLLLFSARLMPHLYKRSGDSDLPKGPEDGPNSTSRPL